jgi:catechol 2,3-dioxygenase-like lactoylglutathione lyase family enzyme
MEPVMKRAIPVLPAADVELSLKWWVEICGFKEVFRHGSPPTYAGINRGDAYLHFSAMDDKTFARQIGDQTMVRLAVTGVEGLYAEYQQRGGKVHPNGSLQSKPWGSREFSAIDPNGVCVTFLE